MEEKNKEELISDPFASLRQASGINQIDDNNDPVKMVLRHRDVRKCAHNYKTFQSGAVPGRIVVPSEVEIRDTRQIPFEVDPPEHGAYRSLVEDWFRRPLKEDYEKELKKLIDKEIDNAIASDNIEVVSEFALHMQSRALTLLLNLPLLEAETWIAWGTHVFRSEETKLDASKANILYDYIDQEINKAKNSPGEEIYSVLLNTEHDNRLLSHEEIKGIMILTFAGGRDTVINMITNAIAYMAKNKKALAYLKENPENVGRAVEELVRYFSPLTHMGRVATEDATVCEHAVKSDTRISLCWASANRDETVFENPNEVMLDRKINPHVAFGFSHHKCLGAHHARQVLKVLLLSLAERIESIDITDKEENIETWGEVKRKVGFHKLYANFSSNK